VTKEKWKEFNILGDTWFEWEGKKMKRKKDIQEIRKGGQIPHKTEDDTTAEDCYRKR
jgi:hypothetical protein